MDVSNGGQGLPALPIAQIGGRIMANDIVNNIGRAASPMAAENFPDGGQGLPALPATNATAATNADGRAASPLSATTTESENA